MIVFNLARVIIKHRHIILYTNNNNNNNSYNRGIPLVFLWYTSKT